MPPSVTVTFVELCADAFALWAAIHAEHRMIVVYHDGVPAQYLSERSPCGSVTSAERISQDG